VYCPATKQKLQKKFFVGAFYPIEEKIISAFPKAPKKCI
jgi:hypothetical protein